MTEERAKYVVKNEPSLFHRDAIIVCQVGPTIWSPTHEIAEAEAKDYEQVMA